MMKLEQADLGDLDEIMEIVNQAKQKMTNDGIRQWTENYPGREELLMDITASELLVIRNWASEIVSLGTMTHTPYPASDPSIFSEKDWFVKRLATRPQDSGKGYMRHWIETCVAEYCEKDCSIYAVTNHSNWLMQRLFDKTNFDKIDKIIMNDRKHLGSFYVYKRNR